MDKGDQNTIEQKLPDDVTPIPHLIAYPHHRGSALIRPEDQGKIKGRALSALYQQTDLQLDQIRAQINLLAQQAQAIQDRVIFSEQIYRAEMRFEPLIGQVYHLYENKDGKSMLSLIGPHEWGKTNRLIHKATVRLLADHTWEVIQKNFTND